MGSSVTKLLGVLDGFGCGLVGVQGRRFPTVGGRPEAMGQYLITGVRVAGSQGDRQPEGLG